MALELIVPLGLILLVTGYMGFGCVSLKEKDRAALIARLVMFAALLGVIGWLVAIRQEPGAVGLGVLSAVIATKEAQGRRRRLVRRTARAFTEQTKSLETEFVIVRVNQYTKAVSGEIIAGRFAGAGLETLNFEDLISLLNDYRANDPRSSGVLRTYLDRTQPPGWRERAERLNADKEGAPPPVHRFQLVKEDAFAVLGLKDSASLDDIKLAHRAMMLKVHPDQGGTDYLASMVNHAKEVLIGNL